MRFPTRRQFLAASGSAVSTGLLLPRARAQVLAMRAMRIGVVVPAMTGLAAVRTSINDYAGEGARMGATLAEASIGELASERGLLLKVLHANAPSSEAAHRAGQRMVETGNICALVGGIGDGQAEVLAAIAARARVPFFNIGSSRDALRQGECSRTTFHIEASAAMYLDALVAWSAAQGRRRWFVVHENNDDGRALHARAVKAIGKHGSSGVAVGAAAVVLEQPVYFNEINAALRADADVILLLMNAVDQIAFVGNKESAAPELSVVVFPDVVAQTRDYIVSARELVPEITHRMVLWETTLQTNGAGAFNNVFLTRWGAPTDPTAWGAYNAIKMLFEAAQATGTLDSSALISYFESPRAVFDLGKGPGISFRPWDHQLRQPLYMIEVDQHQAWIRAEIATWIKMASLAAEIPDSDPAGDPVARLDRLGDGLTASSCRF